MRQAGRSFAEYRATAQAVRDPRARQDARAVRRSDADAGPRAWRRRRGDVRGHHAAARADGRRAPDRARGRPDHRAPDPVGRRRRGTAAVRSGRVSVHARRDRPGAARARRDGRPDRILRSAVHAGLLPHRGPTLARLRDRQGVHVPRAGRMARADGRGWSTMVVDVPPGAGRCGRRGRAAVRQLGRRPRPGRVHDTSSSPTSGGSSRRCRTCRRSTSGPGPPRSSS